MYAGTAGGAVTASSSRWLRANIILLIAGIGLGNLGRAVMALHYARALPDLPLTVPWAYLAGMGIFWGIALIACAVSLQLGRPWSRWVTLAVVTLYQAHVWLNHLLFDASDYARQTRPRDLVLSLLFLAVVWGTLCLPGIRGGRDD
ncbi:MAG: hypothetical protein H5T61_01030 [Thermoflexales bacterium]|nr:hypothetical protein [Thermoflexales bacterium]